MFPRFREVLKNMLTTYCGDMTPETLSRGCVRKCLAEISAIAYIVS